MELSHTKIGMIEKNKKDCSIFYFYETQIRPLVPTSFSINQKEVILKEIDRVATQFENKIEETPYIPHNFSQIASKKMFFQMDGRQYEYYCGDILKKCGWLVTVTQGSGDQGVDVIAEKEGLVVAIQCKKHNQPIGNKAIQEIFAGRAHYKAHIAVVCSSSGYTNSAQQLANSLRVILLSHNDLYNLEKHTGLNKIKQC